MQVVCHQNYAEQVQAQLAGMSDAQLAAALDAAMPGYTQEQLVTYYDEVLVFSDSSYEENLVKLGYLDLNDPASINIYASTFENKEIIEDAISAYNQSADDLSEIHYTDYVGLMMSSVTSIMIGVITPISVQEPPRKSEPLELSAPPNDKDTVCSTRKP